MRSNKGYIRVMLYIYSWHLPPSPLSLLYRLIFIYFLSLFHLLHYSLSLCDDNAFFCLSGGIEIYDRSE